MLTVAPSPNTSRPSFFDLTGRAKWDAWMLAAQSYEGRPSEAENRYLDIARSLGWKEGSSAATGGDGETDRQEERGGGTGMGISVSIISPQTLEGTNDSSELHGYAMRDDVTALSALFSAGKCADIDVRDEYVSLFIMPCYSLYATGGVISDSSRRVASSSVPHTNRDILRSTWLPIGETSRRSSFYSSKAQIRHSR